MKPYYDEGGITIYHGDCRQALGRNRDLGQFDLVVTSPPYNLGVSPNGSFGHWKDGGNRGGGDKWDGVGDNGVAYGSKDALPPTEYMQWQRGVLLLCWSKLTDAGAIFYNHKPRVQERGLWLPLFDLPLRQIITWVRSGGTNFAPTHFVPNYEWIMVYAKQAWRLKNRAVSGIGDVWQIPQKVDPEHPASFPLGLPSRAIEATAPQRVLDPFMGVGTTLRAAKDAGIPAVGIEIEERYCEIAVQRLGQEVLPLGVVA